MAEEKNWIEFSEEYDQKVFSLTSFPNRRKQILDKVKKGRVLNLGCGPTSYLNKELIEKENVVVASDFCKEMLDSAKKEYNHPGLDYVLADSRDLPFEDYSFNSVIAINSILPPERKQVKEIFSECYRVLKDNGVLVAFLPSFDSSERSIEELGLEIELDKEQMRERDTSGWQCFHTFQSICKEVDKFGFSRYRCTKVNLDSKEEVSEMKRMYDIDTSECFIYEYLLTAVK